MKQINLITEKNPSYSKYFINTGYDIIEHSTALPLERLRSEIKGKKNSFTVIEATESFLSDYHEACEKIRLANSINRIIIISEEISPRLRMVLLKCGIPDCLPSTDPLKLRNYIANILPRKEKQSLGKILVLDDINEYKQILSTITERLEYNCDFISKVDELFSSIKKNQYKLILLNMGTRGIDINQIIRKSYTDHGIRKFPIIAYKNMDEGMFVHEFLNGLNKLTKVILSPEELFSTILDLLYKRRIMKLLSGMNNTMKFEKYSHYSEETISQIYYDIHRDLCTQENLFTTDHLETTHSIINEMTSILIKIDGLRWLKNDVKPNSRATCGQGV